MFVAKDKMSEQGTAFQDDGPFQDEPRPVNGHAVPAEAAPAPKRKRKDRKAYSTNQAKATLDEGKERQILFPIKKPGSTNFFRVCTEPDSRMAGVWILDGGMDGFYLVHPSVVNASKEVRRRAKEATLITCKNHNGKYFVWPILHGNPKTAAASFKVVREAEETWIRINWDNFSQSYNPELPDPDDFPELALNPDPTWEPSGSEILDEAFADCSIDELGSLTLKKVMANSK